MPTDNEQLYPEDTGEDPEVPLDLLELHEVLEWERAVKES